MQCETCGNEYDKPMRIELAGKTHVFDSFECAIFRLAPHCARCHIRILGHGMEKEGRMYCCAHCAHVAGIPEMTDRL